jgi:hypothetical protein
MGLGDFFGYRGGLNKRRQNMTPVEQQQIASVRKTIFNALSGNNDPKLVKKDKSKIAVSELKDIAVGDFQSQINTFSKQIYRVENNKKERLRVYREMAKYPVVAFAVNEHVNEAVNFDDEGNSVCLKIKNKELNNNEQQRKTIQAEFNSLMFNVIKVNDNIDRWYKDFMIDGEIFFEKIVDNDNLNGGITRVKKLMTQLVSPIYGDLEAEEIMFYTYHSQQTQELLQLPTTMIAYANSGISEYSESEQDISIQSFIEVAKITYRRLKLLEDALVIYRIIRAPERRVFNIDVGNLPKGRAEQYMKETIQNHRQKKFFDPSTGDVTEGMDPIAMTEDYYFPVFSGGRGSKIDTLAGGQNLDQIQDVEFFLKRMYIAMNIPMSRWGDDKKVQFGSSGDINHDELKFLKDVRRFTNRFSSAFKDIFFTHLQLKGITEEYGITLDDFDIQMFSNNLYEMFLNAKKLSLKFDVFKNFSDLIDTENKPLSQEFVIKKYLDMDNNEWDENVKLRNIEREISIRLAKEAESAGSDAGGGSGGGFSGGGMDDLGGALDGDLGGENPDDGGAPPADTNSTSTDTPPIQ